MYSELKAKGLEARLIAFRESADLVRRTVKERGYVVPSLLDANGDVTGRLYGVVGPPPALFPRAATGPGAPPKPRGRGAKPPGQDPGRPPAGGRQPARAVR